MMLDMVLRTGPVKGLEMWLGVGAGHNLDRGQKLGMGPLLK